MQSLTESGALDVCSDWCDWSHFHHQRGACRCLSMPPRTMEHTSVSLTPALLTAGVTSLHFPRPVHTTYYQKGLLGSTCHMGRCGSGSLEVIPDWDRPPASQGVTPTPNTAPPPPVTSYFLQHQKRLHQPHSCQSFMWAGENIWQPLSARPLFVLQASLSSYKCLTMWLFKVRLKTRVTMSKRVWKFDTKMRKTRTMWKSSPYFLWWLSYKRNILVVLELQYFFPRRKGKILSRYICFILTSQGSRCLNLNHFGGLSEKYLYISMRWEALNWQLIVISPFVFIANNTLPKRCGSNGCDDWLSNL